MDDTGTEIYQMQTELTGKKIISIIRSHAHIMAKMMPKGMMALGEDVIGVQCHVKPYFLCTFHRKTLNSEKCDSFRITAPPKNQRDELAKWFNHIFTCHAHDKCLEGEPQ